MTERATFDYVASQLAPGVDAPARETVAPAEGLHVCAGCGSKLVYPTHWERYGQVSCRVALRCPECDRFNAGLFERNLVDEFERELARGRAELEADLALLANASMAAYADRFVRALNADAIYPIDF
jgi:hypothetical protein